MASARTSFRRVVVAGNIERLEILLGRAHRAVPAIRKRLKILQARGAKYDEIVTRSNLAWALRTLGRHREALHELDVAIDLARDTSTFNVLLEFIHYDRSVVLDALGDSAAARAAYRRYLRLAGPWNGAAAQSVSAFPQRHRSPVEPFSSRATVCLRAPRSRWRSSALSRTAAVSGNLQKALSNFAGSPRGARAHPTPGCARKARIAGATGPKPRRASLSQQTTFSLSI